MSEGTVDFKTGTYSGTGSAINVLIGFQPRAVTVYNLNDAGALDPYLEWTEDMGAGKGFLHKRIVDNGTTANKSHELITTGGITKYAGTVGGDSEGFTIGTNAHINASGEAGCYIAWK